ncbi:right-handed parallel beta-helix repeat-containing protein [Ekhidna sp. To15]|uniref:right-handed parallel beta-helix repeat-containing protein n=1 Tax=Ekhidna sp. To15 TaxID=3395267 RepID=UPI003F52605A
MRNTFLVLLLFVLWVGCSTKDETVSFDPGLMLVFSNDSVAFDTLLSDRRSSTKRLTVFNPNEEAIQFDEIALGKANNSDYQVIINGKQTNELANERLLGGDSLLILVEVNVSPQNQNSPYLVKDSIIFRWNTNETHVKLVSYGQDGNTINSSSICDEVWTNDRPYIVSDTVLVSAGCQLTIEKGTNIYFENDAVMFIQGTLKAIGDSANHIVFRNARFDGVYDRVPGQWDGIYFLEGSADNEVSFAEIFNGQVGLRLGTPDDDDIPDLVVSNTTIFNMSLAGILCFTSDLEATNTLIYNCGNYLFGGFAGGNYTLRHCTLSNEPALFIQDEATVQFSDNLVIGENQLLVEDLDVELVNSIIWGTADEELLINNGGGASVSVDLTANIIRSGEELTNNFTSREFNFPGFVDAFGNKYQLDTLAFAQDRGIDIGVNRDLIGKQRDAIPDIGAYERIEKQ